MLEDRRKDVSTVGRGKSRYDRGAEGIGLNINIAIVRPEATFLLAVYTIWEGVLWLSRCPVDDVQG
jgi:hypothetical protein